MIDNEIKIEVVENGFIIKAQQSYSNLGTFVAYTREEMISRLDNIFNRLSDRIESGKALGAKLDHPLLRTGNPLEAI